MIPANSVVQACCSNQDVEQHKSGPMRVLQFLSRLLACNIAAFALVILTLLGFNAGLDWVVEKLKPCPNR